MATGKGKDAGRQREFRVYTRSCLEHRMKTGRKKGRDSSKRANVDAGPKEENPKEHLACIGPGDGDPHHIIEGENLTVALRP